MKSTATGAENQSPPMRALALSTPDTVEVTDAKHFQTTHYDRKS
jgi:hypothetical protein